MTKQNQPHEFKIPGLYTKAEMLEAIKLLPREEQLVIYRDILDRSYNFHDAPKQKKGKDVGKKCPSVVVIPYYIDVQITEA